MIAENISDKLVELKDKLEGDLYLDESSRLMYSTDASVYREVPTAVARPKGVEDLKQLISFANGNGTSLIPRTAGTSLAGQVVGGGIVVDVSRYMTNILEINEQEKWVRVQPGVILDELNQVLEKKSLFFGPETSTSNRCMIGGMVGNNACGSHSIIYGSTRDHTISVKMLLGDGSEAEFTSVTATGFNEKCEGDKLENSIYQKIREILSDNENKNRIRKEYPDISIKRRNTGYAIDLLLESNPFTEGGDDFNMCKIIAGSEGTLGFITEIKLNLVPLPPKEKALLCAHFDSLEDALNANIIALKHGPAAVELIDDVVIKCTEDNILQRRNRFFIKGYPEAILIIELINGEKHKLIQVAGNIEEEMKSQGLGYHFPLLFDDDIKRVWALRKAALGLLSNVPGDSKPVAAIEDTVVKPEDLPSYIKDFKILLDKYGLSCVYHAHIGSGELHLRPVLNLKKKRDVILFHTIAKETALLVKKYNGSLSGEHGDGRLRGEFIPIMIGEENFTLLKEIKYTWDPKNIFNPGKIVDTPPMNSGFRYVADAPVREIETIFDFSTVHGIVRAAEKCNGSGDCRKTERVNGTMCPSYMATRDEKHSTRARANILREFLTNSQKSNPFDHKEIYEVMDLCLSCKACKSECPSNVDMTKLKAEFLQHYYDSNKIPIRTKVIANISKINSWGSRIPGATNFILQQVVLSTILKRLIGFAPKRSIPTLSRVTLKKWAKRNLEKINSNINHRGTVYVFIDEFTNYNDAEIGIKTIKLLNKLRYRIIIPDHQESGRALLSKGLLRKAKTIANANVKKLKDLISEETPLIGIEPSAILSFRDEYPEIVEKELRASAKTLSDSVFTIDEFISREIDKGNLSVDMFTKEKIKLKLHGHCQQKAIASTEKIKKMLSYPENFIVEEIPSGCCGMAGSFGYEKEHYDISMKIGELVLFPEVRRADSDTLIVAPGTSCRHQIKDGTGREVYHPVEVFYDALK
jgi:FAD/FMN-containing dehydrogenase/Fe-S oxidoreductase